MPKYKITWTEKVYWESKVNAKNKKEALSKINDDEVQENAEQTDGDLEMDNIEIRGMRE